MKFSNVLLCFWFLTVVFSITTVLIGIWIFGFIYLLELNLNTKPDSDEQDGLLQVDTFYSFLFFWVFGEIVASILSLIYSSYLYFRLAQKKLEERIVRWMFLNMICLYATFGCFLFSWLKEYSLSRMEMKFNHEGQNATTPVSSSEEYFGSEDTQDTDNSSVVTNDRVLLLLKVTHIYYMILVGKCVALGGLILGLYEHRHKIKRIDSLLEDLNLGSGSRYRSRLGKPRKEKKKYFSEDHRFIL